MIANFDRCRARIAALHRQGGVKSSELEALAREIGRVKIKRKSKHPVYVMPHRPPLPIPHHGKDMPIGTKRNILLVLEDDLDFLEDGFR